GAAPRPPCAGRGARAAALVAAGLAMPRDDGSGYDRFRNRLMFPIRDRDGRVVGFGGRALGDAQPKYLNSPQTAIFDKGANLYALDLAQDAIRRTRQVVVVEGYMDAIAAHQHGFENVVASMGTALTEAQIGLIRRGVDRIVLALDADAAGQSATLRGLDALRDHLGEVDTDRPILDGPRLLGFERTLKTDIRIARLPAGLDPDDLIRRDPETWRQAIEHPVSLLDFYVDAIVPETPPADPREKSAIVARIAPVLRSIDDAVVRDHYVKEVANRLRISEQRVLSPGASRVVRTGGVAARPGKRPVDYEEHLFALLLRYPEMLWSLIPEVPAQDVLDARRRSILAALQAAPPQELRQAIDALPEELRGHADDLLARTEGHPAGHPGKIRKEAEDTLRALRRSRHDLRWRQLSEELSAARQEGDAEAEEHVRGLIRQLMERYPEFYPDPSPLFPDTRTAAK
ncbi:MAG: toprim domain-containing protein, partial [Thermomicrobiaceae bacterium]|nr:toprim domain-containing protein [Thermomicrobiaceae bacterium]